MHRAVTSSEVTVIRGGIWIAGGCVSLSFAVEAEKAVRMSRWLAMACSRVDGSAMSLSISEAVRIVIDMTDESSFRQRHCYNQLPPWTSLQRLDATRTDPSSPSTEQNRTPRLNPTLGAPSAWAHQFPVDCLPVALPSGMNLIVFCVADGLFDFFLESRWQGEASLLCRIMSLVSFPRTISRRLEWYTRPSCRRAYHDYIRGQTEAGMLPFLSPFRIAHVALSSGHTYKVNLKNHKVIGIVSSRGSRE
jgi:hypothetical protein